MRDRLQIRVGVAQIVRQPLGDMVRQIANQLGLRWCAHADGKSHARTGKCHAVMGDARRQVQHVARFQQPLMGGGELDQLFQLHAGPKRLGRSGVVADGPVALAQSLQQENIILVDVGAHATAILGVGNHDVIHAPAGQEGKRFQQRGDIRIPLVDILYQQRPVAVWRPGKVRFTQWTGVDVPAVALFVMHDQACQCPFLAGQSSEIVRRQRRLEVGKGVADQHRPFLPVVAQETGRGHAQRMALGAMDFEGNGGGFAHARIVAVAGCAEPWRCRGVVGDVASPARRLSDLEALRCS